MAFIDEINTVCKPEIVAGVVDNAFKDDPLLAYLRANVPETYTGGPFIQENFRYGVLPGGAYSKGASFDAAHRQIWTGAKWYPKYYYVDVTLNQEDVQVEQKGPNAMFDVVDGYLETAAETMGAMLAIDVYKEGQTTSTGRDKHINGLPEIINDASVNSYTAATYSTYGTLTRTTVGGSKLVSTPKNCSAGEITYPILEECYSDAVIGKFEPNIGVTTNLGYALIKEAFHPLQRITERDLVIGFNGVKLNNAVIMRSQYCPGSQGVNDTDLGNYLYATYETLWLLNTQFFKLWVTDDPEHAFGFSGFKVGRTDSMLTGQYKFAGNLTCIGPRYQKQIYGFK